MSHDADLARIEVSEQPDLFNADYYRAQNPDVDDTVQSLWSHFCEVGFRANRNPHPLFDTKFYREKHLTDGLDVNPLLHYIEYWPQKLDTHPLLDVKFYVAQLEPQMVSQKPAKQTWLEYFLENNLHDLKSASIEFSSERYIENYPDILQEGENPLCHYLTKGASQGRLKLKDWKASPPLFDERYYLESNPDLKNSTLGPWRHFCEHGFKENRNPHPVFHTAYYREKYLGQTPDVNPLLHYEQQSEMTLDPHPLFDAAFYLSQISMTTEELATEGITPLEHFLKHNRKNLASPSPLFSSRRYLEKHQDLASCKANPLYHFIVHGQGGAGRHSSTWSIWNYCGSGLSMNLS